MGLSAQPRATTSLPISCLPRWSAGFHLVTDVSLVRPKISAKNAAEAILSVAGTMVWSKLIVMAYLQVGRSALGLDEISIASWSCQRLAYPPTKQGRCQLRTT